MAADAYIRLLNGQYRLFSDVFKIRELFETKSSQNDPEHLKTLFTTKKSKKKRFYPKYYFYFI